MALPVPLSHDQAAFDPGQFTGRTPTNYGLKRTEYPHTLSHNSSRNPILTVPLRITPDNRGTG